MDISKIEILLRAIELGSLSKASNEFLYTPSAVSHILDSIENEVGVKALYETNGMYLYSIVVNGQLQEVFITDKKFTSGYTGICSEEMSIVVNSDNA